MGAGREPIDVTPELLRARPLPRLHETADKEARGRVLCVGGSAELAGALILAGTAALRAGAGKLQLATVRGIATAVGVTIPEARVFGLEETERGGIHPAAVTLLAEWAPRARAVLIGPGLVDADAVQALLAALLPHLDGVPLVLDAAALECAPRLSAQLRARHGGVVLTPHAGEMAAMLGLDKDAVADDTLAAARRAAEELGAVIALKGADTLILDPRGDAYCYRGGTVGLATSGSGDALAGVIAGLLARGADPPLATLWAVALHGGAGVRLGRRMGALGFLARELLAEIPPLMAELSEE
jgi:hydroxyethylthiazole kinase-like uncharacterized protein yjeF